MLFATVVLALIALVFFVFGIVALLSKAPIFGNFWSENHLHQLNSDDITNVRHYNRANGFLFLAHALFMLLLALLSHWSSHIDLAWIAFIILAITVPMFSLIFGLNYIAGKFRIQKRIEPPVWEDADDEDEEEDR